MYHKKGNGVICQKVGFTVQNPKIFSSQWCKIVKQVLTLEKLETENAERKWQSNKSHALHYLAVARCERSLAEHGETGGTVPCGTVVPDPACVFSLIRSVHSPRLQEQHHVSHLSDHGAIGQLQVIFWVPITTTWQNGQTDIWCMCRVTQLHCHCTI